jgi:hypothetical protein
LARTVLRVQTSAFPSCFHLRHDSGGHSVGETPVPIPNTEVKPDTPMVLTGKPVGRVGRCQGHVFFHIYALCPIPPSTFSQCEGRSPLHRGFLHIQASHPSFPRALLSNAPEYVRPIRGVLLRGALGEGGNPCVSSGILLFCFDNGGHCL